MGIWDWFFGSNKQPSPPPRRKSPPPQRAPSPPPRPPSPPPSKLLPKPWIDANPFKEAVPSYREKVIAPTMHGTKEKYNLLVAGHVGAGKSSYVNSLLTATSPNEVDISEVAVVRNDPHSVTFEVHRYPLGDRIDLYDMPGYDPEINARRFNLNILVYKMILDGKVPVDTDLRDEFDFCEEDPSRKIDAVLLVLDASKMMTVTEGSLMAVCKNLFDASKMMTVTEGSVMAVYKTLVDACTDRHIRCSVILSKVDELCEEVDKDITKVYQSKAVGRMAQAVHERLGLKKKFTVPIVNYVDQFDRDPNMDKLLLHSLDVTVQQAEDHAKYYKGIAGPQMGVSPSFQQPVVPTASCSEGPLFRRSVVPTDHCSNAPLLPRSSDGLSFRRPVVPTARCSDGPLFRRPVDPTACRSDAPLSPRSSDGPSFQRPVVLTARSPRCSDAKPPTRQPSPT